MIVKFTYMDVMLRKSMHAARYEGGKLSGLISVTVIMM